MAEEAATPEKAAGKPKKRLPMTLLLVLGVSVVEGAGFLAAFKFFGAGPQETYGSEGQHAMQAEEATPAGVAEVPLLQRFRVPNNKNGRTWIYDFDIQVVVAAAHKPEMEKLIAERGGEIADRVAQIIRSADVRVLNEDDFRTLRMQIRSAVNEVAGNDEFVQRVLIPRCVPLQGN